MQVAILLLLVAALASLVLGLISANSSFVVASIVVSLIAVVAIIRARQRRVANAAEVARLAKIEAADDERTRLIAVAAAAVSRSAIENAQPQTTDKPAHRAAEDPADEAGEQTADETAERAAETVPPLATHGGDPVWVIAGRLRYHVWGCEFVRANKSESLSLSQAIGEGFTPCARCDPDTKLSAAPTTS